MKNPAQSWTATHPDSRFADLPLDIQELVCIFHVMPVADSTASRSPIPGEAGH
ncbi:MAG: hypothetical protein GWN46_11350 [Gammaproteobacteria bacterium]|nr:hypothetical protein [Gammaproteobacteria bacterium]NIW36530.1 hypothetical protein [Gemmatimonadota bacterium]